MTRLQATGSRVHEERKQRYHAKSGQHRSHRHRQAEPPCQSHRAQLLYLPAMIEHREDQGDGSERDEEQSHAFRGPHVAGGSSDEHVRAGERLKELCQRKAEANHRNRSANPRHQRALHGQKTPLQSEFGVLIEAASGMVHPLFQEPRLAGLGLLARHHGAHLRLLIDNQFAGNVDDHVVYRAGECAIGFVAWGYRKTGRPPDHQATTEPEGERNGYRELTLSHEFSVEIQLDLAWRAFTVFDIRLACGLELEAHLDRTLGHVFVRGHDEFLGRNVVVDVVQLLVVNDQSIPSRAGPHRHDDAFGAVLGNLQPGSNAVG